MELTAYTLASSSKGNSVWIRYGSDELLIDAGISCRRIESALRQLDDAPPLSNVGAVLVTHEHSDHIAGLPTLAKKYHIPIHMTEDSARAMLSSRKYLPTADFITVHPRTFEIKVGEITVRSFATPHDSASSVGYLVSAGGRTIAIATDIGHISATIENALTGADYVILESNHDVNMLLSGSYPYELKRRILSDRGHLSNENAAEFARRLAGSGTRQIVLAHLSPENNIPELALTTAKLRLAGTGCGISVAKADTPTLVCGSPVSEEVRA